MTIEQIEARVKEVSDCANDSEHAHRLEDSLHLDFINYVATLSEQPELAAKAKLVASTDNMQFSRWYA
jgi:hypothetical protein